jgi:hypothetical protein
MSIAVMTEVWNRSQHSGSELLMLLAIADFSDDNGKAYPSVNTLSRKCRMSRRNVQYIINNLKGSGELSVGIKKGPPPKFPNLYRVNINALKVQPIAQVKPSAHVQTSERTSAIQRTSDAQPIAHKPSVIIKNHQKGFSEFWNAYPNCKRKGSKNKCQSVWKKQNFESVAEQIIAHVTSMANSNEWMKDSGQYIPAPLTYLNQQRWDGAEVGTQATSNEVIF